jgi:hypothetical protein
MSFEILRPEESSAKGLASEGVMGMDDFGIDPIDRAFATRTCD